MLGLEMADDRLDGGPPLELAFDLIIDRARSRHASTCPRFRSLQPIGFARDFSATGAKSRFSCRLLRGEREQLCV